MIFLPQHAFGIQNCTLDGYNCVTWHFLGSNNILLEEPPTIIINTKYTNQATINWVVDGETGKGVFQFQTTPHASSGLRITNCQNQPINGFDVSNGNSQVRGKEVCTITVNGDSGSATLDIDIGINNGQTLNPFVDTSGHYIGPTAHYTASIIVGLNSHSSGPNVVPEFGSTGTIVLVVSIIAAIVISSRFWKTSLK